MTEKPEMKKETQTQISPYSRSVSTREAPTPSPKIISVSGAKKRTHN